MGEAKNRGTYEERRAEAVKDKKFVLAGNKKQYTHFLLNHIQHELRHNYVYVNGPDKIKGLKHAILIIFGTRPVWYMEVIAEAINNEWAILDRTNLNP